MFKGLFKGKKKEFKSSSELDDIHIQFGIVANWLAAHAPEGWVEAKVACKFFEDSKYGTFFYLVGDQMRKEFSGLSIKQSMKLYHLFNDLRAKHNTRDELWVGRYYHLKSDGKFDIEYFYEDFDLDDAIDGRI